MKTLFLMQGIPGSGKSTKARSIAEVTDGQIFSTDEFWGPDYAFDPDKTGLAHRWNQARVRWAMVFEKTEVIIVDNTNLSESAMEPYRKLAEHYDYHVKVVRVSAPLEVCLARNAERPEHRRIPEDVVRDMYERMMA